MIRKKQAERRRNTENKKRFVEELGRILAMYSVEKVLEFKYIEDDTKEYIEITYTNRSVKYVNITGDSCVSVLRDIYYAVL